MRARRSAHGRRARSGSTGASPRSGRGRLRRYARQPNRRSTISRRAGRSAPAIGTITKSEQPQGRVSSAANAGFASDRRVARQRWEHDDPERHADDPDRDLKQREGDVEARSRRPGQRRCEGGHHDERDLAGPEAERPRRHQDQWPCGPAGPRRSIARLVAEAQPCQRRELDEEVAEGAGHDADREARRRPSSGPRISAPPMIAEVVDDRREGRRPRTGRSTFSTLVATAPIARKIGLSSMIRVSSMVSSRAARLGRTRG